jgi:hypothetical protein
MLTVAKKVLYVECRYAECCYAECHGAKRVYEETGLLGEDDTQGIGAGVLKIKIKKKHIFLSKKRLN